ncbi:sigma-54-dependent transcriptional regulator [Microscilla marina]|uniref:Nitrogen regulation protein NR n=1 Tax=Microscilla marina ATCC 23134 TaxID=313606 RepID=A1ZS98_MICM2|nr:sigma-54 dependent transcriptional regulator [Microscilla marina]EAY26821.1 nitrogen regulation protein NR [Microscilla marina ATCC 23134]
METSKIFVVEDDDWYAKILMYTLSLNPDYEVIRFKSAKEVLASLHLKPSIITLDYSLPDTKGPKLLKQLKERLPDVPVVVVSGQEDITTAVSLLKEGAYDYIVKDENTKENLWKVIHHIRDHISLKKQIDDLREEVERKYTFDKIIKGNSPAIQRVFRLMEKATSNNITVSITGETGTGKELVAKAIHYNSNQKKKSFVAVNVAAIPKELIESELFGHEKGAFTGAVARRIGKFEEAHKGTLFLDEIGEMDLNMQAKLLRVLQERELSRVGGNELVKIDVRLIVATHKNLLEEVQQNNFREDLYYRLLGLPIVVPPLRERGSDIILLAKYFVEQFCKENKMPPLKISPEVNKKLLQYPFPGNIRELKAMAELAAVMANGDTIYPEDITFNTTRNTADFLLNETTLREYNQMILRYFLQKYDNNVLLVAQKLDIGKSTIYRMIKNGEVGVG